MVFKCQLFPNEQTEPEAMSYPLIASYKLDGARMIFNKGELQTRSGKPVVNIRIHEKYQWLKDITSTLGIVIDGEFYSHEAEFGDIMSVFRSHDKEVPEDMEFWAFDYIEHELNYDFETRHHYMMEFCDRQGIKYPDSFIANDSVKANAIMRLALQEGYEGLILLSPNSRYKHGRITAKSGDGYKLKPYLTFDSKIISVVQATEVDPNADKTINELGRSVTSKKQDDRILIEKAAAFEIIYEGQTVKVVLAMTDKEKEEVWRNKEDYIGRTIEWKGMTVGMKDVPRHPVFLRFRPDKDE